MPRGNKGIFIGSKDFENEYLRYQIKQKAD